jgi:hypothetical protein
MSNAFFAWLHRFLFIGRLGKSGTIDIYRIGPYSHFLSGRLGFFSQLKGAQEKLGLPRRKGYDHSSVADFSFCLETP